MTTSSALWMGAASAGGGKLGKPDTSIEVGYLEVIWGDPAEEGPARVSVTLVNERGRVALDPEQAQLAAEDLMSLAGQEVAVYRSRPTGPIEALVPAGSVRATSTSSAAPQIHNWMTLACKFADDPFEPVSIGWLDQKYGRMRGRIGHYWHEVSYGNLGVRGKTHGWFTLPRPRTHYLVDGVLDTRTLGEDCLEAASTQVDFAGVDGINIAVNRQVGSYAYGGRMCGDLPAGFTTSCVRMTWLPPFGYRSMRVFMHEMGHAYGWPHSNNSDGDDDPYDNVWDIMSASLPGPAHPFMGSYPHYPTVWHRQRLGWIPQERIEVVYENPRFTRLVHLDWATDYTSTGKHMLILRENPPRDRDGNVSQPDMGVHYTLEARRPTGFDRNLPGEAVIIHRMRNGMDSVPIAQDADVPPATRNNNPGSMFTEGETWIPDEGLARVRILKKTPHGFLVAVDPVR